MNLLVLRTPRSEGKNQAHSCIYVPQAQQNILQSTLQRGAKAHYSSTFVSTRQQSATTQASRQEQVFAESHHEHVRTNDIFFVLFPLCCSLNTAYVKAPTTNFDFSKYRRHSALWRTAVYRRIRVFLVWSIRCDWCDLKQPSLCRHFNYMIDAATRTDCVV